MKEQPRKPLGKMTSLARLLCVALTGALILAGCGFQPLYGQYGSSPRVQAELAAIKIDVRTDPLRGERLDQLVYASLVNQLTPYGTPEQPGYHLKVSARQISEGVGFEEDDSVTRFNVQVNSDWQLIDAGSRAVLLTASSRSIAAYNVVTSQFATLTAEKDAQERAAGDLANDIRLQLSLYFRTAHTPGADSGPDPVSGEPGSS